MSKIYEALRQAELDRANSPEVPAAQVPPIDQAPLMPTATRVSASTYALSGPFSGGATSPSPKDTALVAPSDDLPRTESLDLSRIPEIVWNPSLHQLPALEQRGSSVEQFRSLRSRMQEFRSLNTLKSLLVSSGVPQEGKSFITINLAISFARHKAGRVLLIDGDMRRPSLHRLLGAPEGPGLTEYLAGKSSLLEVMQRPKPSTDAHPLPPGLASLIFIPGGRASDKAADLSGNHRFEQLLANVAPYFDWIVVDSSPVNLVSDGVNLARACDGVLMVARGGSTKYPTAQHALAELKAAKVLGFVLNAVEELPPTQGYYGYDGYDKVEE